MHNFNIIFDMYRPPRPKSKKKGQRYVASEGAEATWLAALKEVPPLEGVLKGRTVFIKRENERAALIANGCFGSTTVPRRFASLPPSLTLTTAIPVGTRSPVPVEESEPVAKKSKTEGEELVCCHDTVPTGGSGDDQSGWVQLFPEETLYLFRNSCLLVRLGGDFSVLPYPDLWRRLALEDCRFAGRFSAYCHLRSQGWVVKHGLKFGTDFLLYVSGPAHFHSSYALIVRDQAVLDPTSVPRPVREPVMECQMDSSEKLGPSEEHSFEGFGSLDSGSLPSEENIRPSENIPRPCEDIPRPCERSFLGPSKEFVDKIRESSGNGPGGIGAVKLAQDRCTNFRLSWRQVIGMVRVNDAAGKGLVVCDVTPRVSLGQSLATEEVVEKAGVTYTVVKRWLPEKMN